MKLRFKKDTDFIFRDYNDEFDAFKMTIKENTIIDIDDNESKILENYPQVEFNRFYHITFSPYTYYHNNQVTFEILKESEEFDTIEELVEVECFIYINADDVEEVKEYTT